MGKTWDDDRVELLKKFWREGLSASHIASRIGGVSRNAVIGKVHREGLPGRASATRRKVYPKAAAPKARKRVPKPAAAIRRILAAMARDPIPAARPDDVARVVFDLLKAHHCRWPVGDPGSPGFGYCGCKKVDGAPYCEDHVRRAFTGLPQVRVRPPLERYARKHTAVGGKYVLAEV